MCEILGVGQNSRHERVNKTDLFELGVLFILRIRTKYSPKELYRRYCLILWTCRMFYSLMPLTMTNQSISLKYYSGLWVPNYYHTVKSLLFISVLFVMMNIKDSAKQINWAIPLVWMYPQVWIHQVWIHPYNLHWCGGNVAISPYRTCCLLIKPHRSTVNIIFLDLFNYMGDMIVCMYLKEILYIEFIYNT